VFIGKIGDGEDIKYDGADDRNVFYPFSLKRGVKEEREKRKLDDNKDGVDDRLPTGDPEKALGQDG
jgi:hypothetical protein